MPWGNANFGKALAAWLNVPDVQLECSGTSALMVALRTLKKNRARAQPSHPAGLHLPVGGSGSFAVRLAGALGG